MRPSHFSLRPKVNDKLYANIENKQDLPRQNWHAIGVRLGTLGDEGSEPVLEEVGLVCNHALGRECIFD